jgi:hypothetical protein
VQPNHGAIIYLLGYAGCGKLTIAKEIQRKIDCILVDNHLINNVIFSLVDPDGKSKLPEAVWLGVLRVRSAVLDTIRDAAKPGRSFVFTNELKECDERSHQYVNEIAALARHRDSIFLPVRLLVEPAELAGRVVSPDRGPLLKEIDPALALAKDREGVLIPRIHDYLEIDISNLEPGIVANQIVEELRRRENT